MLQTVIQQNYTGILATDTSGFFNHGFPIQVTPTHPGFSFASSGSRINVRPSPSLSTLGVINLEVKFSISPSGHSVRYNLAEGFESFALYVNPDLSLAGTILDASGNWAGASSPAGTVKAHTTQVAALQSDGINMVRVLLDGAVVASSYNVDGQVRGIGSLGMAIGHWPDPPDQYTFAGTIYAVLLQRYDPQTNLSYVDPCCFDRAALAAWLRAAQAKGLTRQKMLTASKAVQAVSLQAARALRGNSVARTRKHQLLTMALNYALKQRDCDALEEALKLLAAFMDAEISAADRAQLESEMRAALALFGLGSADWLKLIKIFCISGCG